MFSGHSSSEERNPRLSTVVASIGEVAQRPLVQVVEEVAHQKWGAISSRCSQSAMILVTYRLEEPVCFAILDTEMKERKYLYVKRLTCRKDLDQELVAEVTAHVVAKIKRQAAETGFGEVWIEEDRPLSLQLLKASGFKEWRREIVMEKLLEEGWSAERVPGVSVERISGDVDLFVHAWNEIVLTATKEEPFIDFSPITAQYIREKLSKPGTVLDPEGWFVAYIGDRVCGLVTVSKLGEIGDLMVATWARRRGVGTALLASALSLLRERGFSKVSIRLREENVAARALYAKLGFKEKVVGTTLVAVTRYGKRSPRSLGMSMVTVLGAQRP